MYILMYWMISLFLAYLLYRKTQISFVFFGFVFIFITHFLGYATILFRDQDLFDESNYRYAIENASHYSFFCLVIYFNVVYFFSGKVYFPLTVYSSEQSDFFLKIAIVVMYLFSALSLLIYFFNNGVSWSSVGDYGDRLDSNAGNGFLLINMIAFIPATILMILRSEKKSTALYGVMFCIIFGGLYFFIVGGSRNILFSGLFTVILISYFKNYISRRMLFFYTLGMISSISWLMIVRYNVILDGINVTSVLSMLTSYFGDSVSPVDYQSIAVNYVSNNNSFMSHPELFINQFSSFVPRFIWPDKPIVVMNSSYPTFRS